MDRMKTMIAPYGLLTVLFTSCTCLSDAGAETRDILTAANPNPQVLPTLGVWQDGKLILVSARFPNVPDFTCDSWCYESDVDFLNARDLGGGRLEIRHRVREQPNLILVTHVLPEPGAVEFIAHPELDGASPATMPASVLTPNLCWQLRRAKGFASAPDPYPEFVKRCFIFTEKGRTFLDKTHRRKIPCRPADDKYNNPPWVQMYVGTWQDIPQCGPTSWADYSTDRYATTVIGAVSRDGKYLAAMANDSATLMCQAWHDCLHNNPQWSPTDAPPARRVWRLKIYVMENTPEALLARVIWDFPRSRRLAGAESSAGAAPPQPQRAQ